jgi:hypothetical protein
LGHQIERNEVSGACSTYGERRGVHRVLVGHLREGEHLEDAGIDVRIIYQWIFGKWVGRLWAGLI